MNLKFIKIYGRVKSTSQTSHEMLISFDQIISITKCNDLECSIRMNDGSIIICSFIDYGANPYDIFKDFFKFAEFAIDSIELGEAYQEHFRERD